MQSFARVANGSRDAVDQRMRQKRLIAGLVLAISLLLSAGAFAFPIVGALVCPICYGFDALGDNTFVENSLTTAEREQVADVVAEARSRVRAFYGDLTARPRILVCHTERCDQRLGGGGARGSSLIDVGLRLSARGVEPVIASHELSHIELHHRLGRLRFLTGAIPAWFDEGVAVVVSDDPRYLAPIGAPNRCLVKTDDPLPSGAREWTTRAREDDHLYAKAACRVVQWLSTNGGPAAATQLLQELSTGISFEDA